MMSVEQLKNEIHKQTIIIKELTSKQAALNKINEVMYRLIRFEISHNIYLFIYFFNLFILGIKPRNYCS